jgi:ABC-type multidrug transport system permease subunit
MSNSTKAVAAALAAALLAGCATAPGGANYAPMVDTGARIGVYEQDLAECQSYAQRVAGASEGAAAGAVGGAIVIGLLSAVLGGGGHGRWAAAGAISGGLSGAAAGEANQRAVVVRCMSGRGYSTLN